MSRLTRLSLAHRTVVMLLSPAHHRAGSLRCRSAQAGADSVHRPAPGQRAHRLPRRQPRPWSRPQVSKPIESAVKARRRRHRGHLEELQRRFPGDRPVGLRTGSRQDGRTRSAAPSTRSRRRCPAASTPRCVTGGIDDIPIVILALSSDDNLTDLSAKVTDVVAPALQDRPRRPRRHGRGPGDARDRHHLRPGEGRGVRRRPDPDRPGSSRRTPPRSRPAPCAPTPPTTTSRPAPPTPRSRTSRT